MRWFDRVAVSLTGTLIVIIGVYFGQCYLKRQYHPNQQEPGLLSAFAAWDGRWYEDIATEGYHYDADRPSTVVFFPSYPLSARFVADVVRIPVRLSLVVISNVCLIAICLLLYAYISHGSHFGVESQDEFHRSVVLCFSLFPMTLFYRTAYSESMFLLIVLLAMLGMQRKWPLILIAVLIGLSTATRTVGVALLLPFALHVYQQSERLWKSVFRFVLLLPLATWGLCAYLTFLYNEYGDAFASVENQKIWALQPEIGLWDKIVILSTLEPLWSAYLPYEREYWQLSEVGPTSPVFSLYFWNPIVFSSFVVLSVLGYAKDWINSKEFLLCIALLGVPYVSQAYETMMRSQARYSTVAFPVYFAMGQLLCRLPISLKYLIILLFGVFLCLFSMLFGSWHRVI